MSPKGGALFALRAFALGLSAVAGLGAFWLFLQFGAADRLDMLDIIRALLILISTLWLAWGAAQALIGLFSAFMPPLVSYFVPWGYFVPLSCYEIALWDRATHTVTYGLRPYSWGLLAFTVVLAAALFAAAWRMMRDKEV